MTLATIMPNYNHAQFLPTSIGAILGQSHPPDELIVIDDGSTDNSVEVISSLFKGKPNCFLVLHTKNRGPIQRCNEGLGLTKADCVHFAAADDEIMPGLYGKAINLLDLYPEAALCCAIAEVAEPDGGFHWRVGSKMSKQVCRLSPNDLIDLGRKGRLDIATPTSILRRSRLQGVGNLVSSVSWNADWFANYAMAFRDGLCFIPEVMCKVRLSGDSISNNMWRLGQDGVFLAVLRELDKYHYFAHSLIETGGLGQLGGIKQLLRSGYANRYLNRRFVTRRLTRLILRAGRQSLPKPIGQAWLNLCRS